MNTQGEQKQTYTNIKAIQSLTFQFSPHLPVEDVDAIIMEAFKDGLNKPINTEGLMRALITCGIPNNGIKYTLDSLGL